MTVQGLPEAATVYTVRTPRYSAIIATRHRAGCSSLRPATKVYRPEHVDRLNPAHVRVHQCRRCRP